MAVGQRDAATRCSTSRRCRPRPGRSGPGPRRAARVGEQRDVRERFGLAEEIRLLDVGDVDGAGRQAAVGRRIEDARSARSGCRRRWPCWSTVSLEPPSSTMKTWIGVGSGAAVDAGVGVGVRAVDDEGRAHAAGLADRAGRRRGAVAPVDRGREVGERSPRGWRR